jgi:RING finger family protein
MRGNEIRNSRDSSFYPEGSMAYTVLRPRARGLSHSTFIVAGREILTPSGVFRTGPKKLPIHKRPVMECELFKVESESQVFMNCSSCAACLEDFIPGKNVIKIGCNHLFHRGCLENWLKNKRTCPNCRVEISDKPLPEFIEELINEEEFNSLYNDSYCKVFKRVKMNTPL